MTPTLVHQPQRARDWAEIQERMLVPLYEAVYERLEVGSSTRLLGLGCGSGLALLLAAARGASVSGVETDVSRLALARERLLPEPHTGAATGRRDAHRPCVWLEKDEEAAASRRPAPDMVTAFDALPYGASLERCTLSLRPGTPVVLGGWGPPERCGAASVLDVATRLAASDSVDGQDDIPGSWRPGGRDDLEELARRAGLRLDGSGRVSCPFGYPDMASAVRGLLSTGLYDTAVRAADEPQVRAELTEALRPRQRHDGTVWMPNLFRYVIARA